MKLSVGQWYWGCVGTFGLVSMILLLTRATSISVLGPIVVALLIVVAEITSFLTNRGEEEAKIVAALQQRHTVPGSGLTDIERCPECRQEQTKALIP